MRRMWMRIHFLVATTLATPLTVGAQAGGTFVPGGQELVLLDFSKSALGSIPVSPRVGHCLATIPVCDIKGDLEVVMQNGTPMLRANARSSFVVTLPQRLPADFTLEFDLIPKTCCQPEDLAFEGTREITQSDVSANVLWHHTHQMIVGGVKDQGFSMAMPAGLSAAVMGSVANIAVSFRGTSLTMYTNNQQIYTVQREFVRGSVLRVFLGGQNDTDRAVYLARMRIATGPPVTVAAAPPSPATGMVSGPSSLGRAPTGTPTVMAGAAPTGLAVTASTPASVTLSWNAAPGATAYTLMRTTGTGQPWVTVTTPAATSVTYTDASGLDHRLAYTYRLQATYNSGPPGHMDLNVTLPAPQDPSGFTALFSTPSNVHLSWQPVAGVSTYLVNGPGLAGTPVTGTTFVVRNAPAGNNAYRVASIYGAAGVLTPASSWPSATVRVAPVPIVPFLTVPNGMGNTTMEWHHNEGPGICWDENDAWSSGCVSPNATGSLKQIFDFWGQVTRTRPLLPMSKVLSEMIAFSDPVDLGFGRRVWCGVESAGLMCIANSHGATPGTAGANAAQQNADAAALNTGSRGYTVISRQDGRNGGKLFFYQLGYPGGVDPTTAEPDPLKRFEDQLKNSFSTENRIALASMLDSEGAKFAPHVCLSCHGGRFNPADNSVIGGSFLPIDPSRLVFSTLPGATRADQEKKIQDINRLISYNTTPLVGEYISKLYGGNWTLPARGNVVPAGWTGQTGLWNQVVRPFCIMCHMAQTGPLAFASFSDMMLVKDRVQKSVCTDGTMPHSELSFRSFWKLTPSGYPADILSTALGFTSCP